MFPADHALLSHYLPMSEVQGAAAAVGLTVSPQLGHPCLSLGMDNVHLWRVTTLPQEWAPGIIGKNHRGAPPLGSDPPLRKC